MNADIWLSVPKHRTFFFLSFCKFQQPLAPHGRRENPSRTAKVKTRGVQLKPVQLKPCPAIRIGVRLTIRARQIHVAFIHCERLLRSHLVRAVATAPLSWYGGPCACRVLIWSGVQRTTWRDKLYCPPGWRAPTRSASAHEQSSLAYGLSPSGRRGEQTRDLPRSASATPTLQTVLPALPWSCHRRTFSTQRLRALSESLFCLIAPLHRCVHLYGDCCRLDGATWLPVQYVPYQSGSVITVCLSI